MSIFSEHLYILLCPETMAFLAALTLVLFIIWIIRYMQTTYSVLKNIKLPHPRPVWLFGNLPEFQDKNPLDVFKSLREKFGDIYGFYEGLRPSIVVNDPEMTKQILVKHFDKFYARTIYTPMTYYPDEFSLLNTAGEMWKHQRAVVSKAFNKMCIKTTVQRINEVADELLSHLTKADPNGFDITWHIDRFSMDAFAYAGFNYRTHSFRDGDSLLLRYMKSFNKSSSTENQLVGLARVYNTLIPIIKLFDRKHKAVHQEHLQEMRRVVKARRQELKGKSETQLEEEENDILSRMMVGKFACRDTLGTLTRKCLDDEEIVGHIHSLVGGGIGTLNAVVAFVLHMLAVHPKAQQTAYEEVMTHLGSKQVPDQDTVASLDYLDMVIYETVRLLPVAPGVTRLCMEDCTINGVDFKKGMAVRIMSCTLYSDDKYFHQPEKFKPERFSEENKKDYHPYLFIPFGQGPRMCVGMKFAMLIMKMSLVRILQKYTILPCQQTQDPLPTVLRPMLSPKEGVYVRLEPRKDQPISTQG